MKRIGGMATIESRKDTLQKVVDSILPQLDELIVVFNGFRIPRWLFGNKYQEVVAIYEQLNFGDAMKFFWADAPNEIYFAFDDDLLYPMGYCSYLEEGVLRYKGVVGLHGRTYPPVVTDYKTWDQNYRCLGTVDEDVKVDLIGTGCCAFNTNQIKVKLSDFPNKNMADVQFSKLCHEQNIPMYVLKHRKGYLGYLPQEHTIWRDNPDKSTETAILKSFLNSKI